MSEEEDKSVADILEGQTYTVDPNCPGGRGACIDELAAVTTLDFSELERRILDRLKARGLGGKVLIVGPITTCYHGHPSPLNEQQRRFEKEVMFGLRYGRKPPFIELQPTRALTLEDLHVPPAKGSDTDKHQTQGKSRGQKAWLRRHR